MFRDIGYVSGSDISGSVPMLAVLAVGALAIYGAITITREIVERRTTEHPTCDSN